MFLIPWQLARGNVREGCRCALVGFLQEIGLWLGGTGGGAEVWFQRLPCQHDPPPLAPLGTVYVCMCVFMCACVCVCVCMRTCMDVNVVTSAAEDKLDSDNGLQHTLLACSTNFTPPSQKRQAIYYSTQTIKGNMLA